MGTLRTLLALAVVLGHAGSTYSPVPGWVAVEMFYVISGFLISLALLGNAKYRSDWLAFYQNRALRLYPIYLLVLAVAAFGYLAFPQIFGKPALIGQEMSLGARLFFLASNILLVGQDWAYFMMLENGHLTFGIAPSGGALWPYYPVPQAWTLGLEITFYAIAPIILLNRRVLLATLIAGVLAKMCTLHLMGWREPWIYRFFPLELGLFLMGAAAHQVLVPLYDRLKISSSAMTTVTAIFICATALYNFTAAKTLPSAWAGFIPAVALSAVLPALLRFQNENRWDRRVGELSYPIYISHWMMIGVSAYLTGSLGVDHPEIFPLVVAGMSVIASVFLNLCVSTPVEWLRASIRSSRGTPAKSATRIFREREAL